VYLSTGTLHKWLDVPTGDPLPSRIQRNQEQQIETRTFKESLNAQHYGNELLALKSFIQTFPLKPQLKSHKCQPSRVVDRSKFLAFFSKWVKRATKEVVAFCNVLPE
jgi:hypothetical protein